MMFEMEGYLVGITCAVFYGSALSNFVCMMTFKRNSLTNQLWVTQLKQLLHYLINNYRLLLQMTYDGGNQPTTMVVISMP